jgi:hypothetical protein
MRKYKIRLDEWKPGGDGNATRLFRYVTAATHSISNGCACFYDERGVMVHAFSNWYQIRLVNDVA